MVRLGWMTLIGAGVLLVLDIALLAGAWAHLGTWATVGLVLGVLALAGATAFLALSLLVVGYLFAIAKEMGPPR